MNNLLTQAQIADMLSVSKKTVLSWERTGKLKPAVETPIKRYCKTAIADLAPAQINYIDEANFVHKNPSSNIKSIELFAGAGGLALGFEKAGIDPVLLNEIDHDACESLSYNRPELNLVRGDVAEIDFTDLRDKVDVVSGGFPCQAFSYAGKKMGLEDARGTLFYEFARCVREVRPKVVIGENVRGLLNHDRGRTVKNMISILEELGYHVYAPKILKAIHYRVPQKRERLILVAKRNDLLEDYEFPKPFSSLYTVRDALKKGKLFDTDVAPSEGQTYPKRKAEILAMVPEGGYWRDLPTDIQREYMLKSYYLGGGKTGMARRMAWDEPSLTLTCAPAQKQTERCHPEQTRPFTVREYARIQTFPDDWKFVGSMNQKYKQIGNAVPVNLAYYIGQSIVRFLELTKKPR